MKRLKVLVSAYACSPCQGSEPGMGWGWVNAMSQHHELWVICSEKFRSETENALDKNPELRDCIHFHYIPRKRFRLIEKLCPLSYYWTYRTWQQDACRLAANLHSEICFDVAHQLNMVGFREPGYLWKLPIPYVWGPIGGLELTPWRFLSCMGTYGALYHGARNITNLLQMNFLPRPRRAADKADANIISATDGIARLVRKLWHRNSKTICEIGIDPQNVTFIPRTKIESEPIRIAWSGQHTPGKALNLLLGALRVLPKNVNWHLDVLGSGSMTKKWKLLAKRYGIDSQCKFHGWLSRENALSVMSVANVFVITSLKDLTSTVLIEAISYGLPVICLDHCGMADVINQDCGIKIPVTTPKQAMRDFSKAIEKLAKNPEELRRLSAGAFNRSKEYSWQLHSQRMSEIYKNAIEHYHKNSMS